MNKLTKVGQEILANAICALSVDVVNGVVVIHHNADSSDIDAAVAIAKANDCSEITLECTPVWGGNNNVSDTAGRWLGAFVSAKELRK